VVVWKQTEAGGEWTSDRLSKFPAAVWRVSWSITGNILAVSGREQRLVRARHARRVLFLPPPPLPLDCPTVVDTEGDCLLCWCRMRAPICWYGLVDLLDSW
jgi:hypothetical protein